jgi:hypothetical protein
VFGVVINGTEHGLSELFAQLLTLLIDVAVVTTAEVDALKRALCIAFLFKYALNGALSVSLNEQGSAGLEFFDFVTL